VCHAIVNALSLHTKAAYNSESCVVLLMPNCALRRGFDNALTFTRRCHDTFAGLRRKARFMLNRSASLLTKPRSSKTRSPKAKRWMGVIVLICALPIVAANQAAGQDTPLISGGVGFFTTTNGGSTTYLPIITPLLAAPLGDHILVESRAAILNSFSPKGGGQPGYESDLFLGLSYLQANFIASKHLTVVAGEFLTPFATYNERLSPIWISNYEDGPLIARIGTMGTASSVGGMVRGSAFAKPRVSLDYTAYFSTASTNQQFSAERASGGRANLYFPKARLELGTSYGRLLQGTHQNFEGVHVWWEPDSTALRLRSEYAHGPHSSGYWIEADYRLSRFHNGESFAGRLEPVLRMQQTYRTQPDANDGLPSANTQRVDFGLDYRLPHEVRLNSSYSREFSSTGNRNIWETGIVYRFLFPAWRGK
jgi:hypothetical protein